MLHSVHTGRFWTSVFLCQKVTIISSRSSGRIASAHRISLPGRWSDSGLSQSEPGAISSTGVTPLLSSESSCASFGSCLLSQAIIFLMPSKNAWCGVTGEASNLASDKTGCRIAPLIPVRMHDGGTYTVDLSSRRILSAAVCYFVSGLEVPWLTALSLFWCSRQPGVIGCVMELSHLTRSSWSVQNAGSSCTSVGVGKQKKNVQQYF